MKIDCNFPGGNIIVERIEGNTAWVYQDLRDTPVDWFYWYLRVSEAAGQTITMHFTKSRALGVRGPGVSFDGGQSWHWLWQDVNPKQMEFTCDIPNDATDARFSFGMPYLEHNLRSFLSQYKDNAHLEQSVLCNTTKGRSAELLRAGRLDGKASRRVLMTCRHHACEMMASYVLEGVIDGILGADGQWLRENVEFVIVPFMDKDGVEDGDQGKSRHPHDHNRDYGVECIHPTVKALRALAAQWSAQQPMIAIDMHCPWIHGKNNEKIYFVGESDQQIWARTLEFSQVLADAQTGPLHFDPADNMPFGKDWNTMDGPDWTFAKWASRLPGAIFGSSLEIPYANTRGGAVTPSTARAFGCDMARGIIKYFKQHQL